MYAVMKTRLERDRALEKRIRGVTNELMVGADNKRLGRGV